MDVITIVYLPETDGVPVTYTGTRGKVEEFIKRRGATEGEYFAFEGAPIKLGSLKAKKGRQ